MSKYAAQVSYNRKRSQRRMRIIRRYKLWQGCQHCGYNTHHAALTFDHRDPSTKVMEVTRGLGCVSWLRIREEIRKCDVLCFNCHMIKTYQNGESNATRRHE